MPIACVVTLALTMESVRSAGTTSILLGGQSHRELCLNHRVRLVIDRTDS